MLTDKPHTTSKVHGERGMSIADNGAWSAVYNAPCKPIYINSAGLGNAKTLFVNDGLVEELPNCHGHL
jgi:hypothetical protein